MRRVGEEINELFRLARETNDYRAEQFMQWFVKEQVEEVALMQDLLNVVERSSSRARRRTRTRLPPPAASRNTALNRRPVDGPRLPLAW